MAYSAGDTILDDEYNAFANSSSSPFGYNHIAGTGSASDKLGLGQSDITTVSAGAAITASQWNTLFTGIINIANHTNVSTSVGSVSAGSTIEIVSALTTDLASIATAVAAGSPAASALTTTSAQTTVTTSSEGWDNTATQEISITWSNANEMRWFFNAGGKIRFTATATASSVSAKDTAFVALGQGFANLDIGSLATTRSATGQSLTTNGLSNGFYDLSTGYTTIIKLTQNSYAAYDANTIEVSAKLNASPGSSTVMTIKMVAFDDAADTQYTSGNVAGAATDVKNTPKMVSAVAFINPTTNEGLSTAYTPSSSAQVSNSTT